MRINTNVSAITSWRMNTINNTLAQKSLQKLSSGLRINSAADDAAGLAISEKMRSQIRGLSQASRNIQDSISLVQTADGGMGEIHNILQRGRELAVQAANDTLTGDDKQKLQDEVSQLMKEVDRIATTTQFNTINLLNVTTSSGSDMQAIIDGLKSAWLQQSEALISARYGLTADNVSLKIVVDQIADPTYAAYVSYMIDGTGKAINQELHIDMSDFVPATLPNGGNYPFYDDRIIAHEMAHAIMGRTMNFGGLTNWFKEGTAEFIHGADERLSSDIAANGVANVVAAIGNGTEPWTTSIQYSSAYAAVRYMHDKIKAAGGLGIRDVMDHLKADPINNNLNTALAAIQAAHPTLPWNSEAAFLADYKGANGTAWVTAWYGSPQSSNTDTGAIGGADADGGAIVTAESVVDDTVNYTSDPLANFVEIWPSVTSAAPPLKMLIGANQGMTMDITLTNVDSTSLGLSNVDLVNQAQTAISRFDTGINYVSGERSRLGAVQNRLEHALVITQMNHENTTAADSRIRDADFSKEMMAMVKNNILNQASISMLAQANQTPQYVLQLIS